MAVNLWVSGESWQIVYGASGRAKGRGVNSYTSRWLDPTHGTRALSSVMVLVAGGQAGGAAPSAGVTMFCCRLLAEATSLAAARSPRHTAARAPLHGSAAHRPPAPEFSLFSSSHVHCKEDLASNPDWFQIFNQTLPRHRIIPDIFRLKRKIPFEEAASTIQPQWGFLPAFQPCCCPTCPVA